MRVSIIGLIIILGCTLMLAFAFTENPQKVDLTNFPTIDSKEINGNNISSWVRNNGSFNRNPSTGNAGFIWPAGSGKTLTYASGLWLSGVVGPDTLMAIANYAYEYAPGYIDSNGDPHGENDSAYRIYKIVKGDTASSDYNGWPVEQGAYLDSNNKPFLPGMQTLFHCMSDGYPYHNFTEPMKAQVQVTSWCYNSAADPVISNTVFSEYKIINKNSLQWHNAVISVWSDQCSIEFVSIACDTNLNLGYAYCQPNSYQFENNPPAFGFLVLQGPAKYTGNINDTVFSFIPGKNSRSIKVGYEEMEMSSFNMFQNGSPIYHQPIDYTELYYTVQGFFYNGDSWYLPGTTTATKFPFSGDPEKGTGWNQHNTMGYGNRRLLMNFGFLNLNPGDTQTIVFAQIVSRGTSNFNSVTKLKQNCQYIQNVFENNFTTVSINNSEVAEVPRDFELNQNFPNPFNPKTIINYELRTKDHTTLKIYDVKGNEVDVLVNKNQEAGKYSVVFDGKNLSSGIYFYKLTTTKLSKTLKMVLLK